MKAGKLVLFLAAGGLFGTGLAVSGMTDPARVIGFLDVFGAWDPALLFVMAGAVGVYGLGMVILRRFDGLKLPSAGSSPIDYRLVIGSAIFGAGWDWAGSALDLRLPIWALFESKRCSSCRQWRLACCWRKDSSEPTDSHSEVRDRRCLSLCVFAPSRETLSEPKISRKDAKSRRFANETAARMVDPTRWIPGIPSFRSIPRRLQSSESPNGNQLFPFLR